MRSQAVSAAVLTLACALGTGAAASSARASCVLEAEVDGLITQGVAEYLAAAIAETHRRPCAALLVTVDTPGGEMEATRRIVRELLSAPVPVITLVTPGGAHAGSAGMFVVLAAHVAAMSPGTSIGAAHPVLGTGEDIPGELAKKVESDTAALARAVATERGRNVKWMEEAVLESSSLIDREAKARDVVDLVAASPEAVLAAAHGRAVRLGGDEIVRLETRGARLEPFAMTIRQRALAVLGNPNLAYLLLMLGMLAIVVELNHPGLVFPGVIGGLSVLLAFVGLNALPVNAGALLLVVAGVGMIAAELYVTSHGVLALGGLVALIAGSALLVDGSSPDVFSDVPVRVSWSAILPLTLVVAAGLGGLVFELGRSRRRPSPTGSEGLLGATALALTALGPGGGEVRVQGERWRARSAQPVAAGVRVRIAAVEGLSLRVEPLASPEAGAGRDA